MGAAQIGEFGGFFFAAAGAGYIFLGLLWATRAYKRWPRASTWSAVAFVAIIGVKTAITSGALLIYGLGTIAACAFMVVRGRGILFPRLAETKAGLAP